MRFKNELDESRDQVDRLEWELESARRDSEPLVTRAKAEVRADHKKELEARDELITLFQEKIKMLREGHETLPTVVDPRESN